MPGCGAGRKPCGEDPVGTLPRAGVLDWEAFPGTVETELAALLLAVPDLVGLDLPRLVAAGGHPGTSVIPAVSSILSLLALKLVGIRRVSHVEDLAADAGAAAFAGLSSLPKTASLTPYSYRLSHRQQQGFLSALDAAMVAAGLAEWQTTDLVPPKGAWGRALGHTGLPAGHRKAAAIIPAGPGSAVRHLCRRP